MVDDLKPRYTTKRLRQEIERARKNDARRIAALEAQLAERVKVPADELTRYINRCREMSENGKYSWWSRLAEILSALEATPPAPKVTEDAPFGWATKADGTPRPKNGPYDGGDTYFTAAQEAGKP